MAKVIEVDGKRVVVVEKEIPVDYIDEAIKIKESLIANIDRNLLGLQARRAKLAVEVQDLQGIKKSLPAAVPDVATK